MFIRLPINKITWSKIGPYGSPLLQEKNRDKMGLTAQVALSCNDGNDPQLL